MTTQQRAEQAYEAHKQLCVQVAACDAPPNSPVRAHLSILSQDFVAIFDYLSGTPEQVDAALGFLSKLTELDKSESILTFAFPTLRELLDSSNDAGHIYLICHIFNQRKIAITEQPAVKELIRRKTSSVLLEKKGSEICRRWCYVFFCESFTPITGPMKIKILDDDTDQHIDLTFVRQKMSI